MNLTMSRTKEFEKLYGELNKKKIPSRIVLAEDGSITVVCGFNYPESLFNRIMGAATRLGIEGVEVTADQHGVTIARSSITGTGPRRYSR